MQKVVLVAMFFTFCVYVTMATFGYLLFGENTCGDILTSFNSVQPKVDLRCVFSIFVHEFLSKLASDLQVCHRWEMRSCRSHSLHFPVRMFFHPLLPDSANLAKPV